MDPTPAGTERRIPSVGHEPEFTVVMPCLNEAHTVATCVTKARSCLDRLGLHAEIIVADNGSTDGSQRLAAEAGALVIDVVTRGYGAALHEGIRAAKGRYVVMGDADDSYDFSRLDGFVERLRDGADIVIGNRFQGGIRPGAMPWKNRYIGNPVLSAIGRRFFRSPVGDFHCGLRGISKAAFDRIELQTTGMEFASEMVIKGTLVGLRIVEVPTTLDPDGRPGLPHLRPWRDGWRHLRFMLLYCPRWLFLYPGLALLTAGMVAIGATLALTPLRRADVATLLAASVGALLGFQGIAFAFCARIYALTERLLPADHSLERLFRYCTLERGLVAGAVVMLTGAFGSGYAVLGWSGIAVAVLDPQEALAIAIPSAALLCVGGQTILTSFLLSIIGLRRRRGEPEQQRR